MSEDKHELEIARYVHHQIWQKTDSERSFPYVIQDTTDYFPYESVYVKTLEEAQQYIQDTHSDFTKIYPDVICDGYTSINSLITDKSLRIVINYNRDDEEFPNMNHIYSYVYSAVYFEE